MRHSEKKNSFKVDFKTNIRLNGFKGIHCDPKVLFNVIPFDNIQLSCSNWRHVGFAELYKKTETLYSCKNPTLTWYQRILQNFKKKQQFPAFYCDYNLMCLSKRSS